MKEKNYVHFLNRLQSNFNVVHMQAQAYTKHIGDVAVAVIIASSSCNPIKTCNLVKSLHFHTICARRGRGLRSKDDIVFWTSLQRRRSLVLSQCVRYIFVYHCTMMMRCCTAPHSARAGANFSTLYIENFKITIRNFWRCPSADCS